MCVYTCIVFIHKKFSQLLLSIFFLYESYLVCDQLLPRRKQNLIQTPRFSTHIIENQKPINTQLFPRSIERRSIIPPSKWKVLSLYEKTPWMEFAVFISFGGLTDEMKVGWTVLFPLSAQHIVIQSTSFFFVWTVYQCMIVVEKVWV